MKQRHRPDNFILFVVKHREDPYSGYATDLGSGVRASVEFVVDMLLDNGVPAAIVEVVDNNDIDKWVAFYNPSVCIIEAIWVVPSKFDQLSQLHPTVTWIVRIHSEVPFLACEGVAVDWLIEYARKPNLIIACNTEYARTDIVAILNATQPAKPDASVLARVVYLPNYYPAVIASPRKKAGKVIQVGCFGAMRLLKNHLIQGVAALRLSERLQRPVHFHINTGRVESQGDPVLKSLRALFRSTPYAKLTEHGWLERANFLGLMRWMDISTQVSMTETFNIVTAEAIACEVPVVASSEVDWLDDYFFADPTSSVDIADHMQRAYKASDAVLAHQRRCLNAFSARAAREWLSQLI